MRHLVLSTVVLCLLASQGLVPVQMVAQEAVQGTSQIAAQEAPEVGFRQETLDRAAALMDSIIVLDTHCDFPEVMYYHPDKNYSIAEKDSRRQVSIEKMRKGHMSAEYLVYWLRRIGDQTDPEVIAKAPAVLWDMVEKTERHLAEHSDVCGIARNREEILALKKQGRAAFLFALENAFWVGDDLGNLQKLKDHGVTYITLSHWGDNQFCHSCDRSEDASLGLTEAGRKLVAEMNRLGIVIDLSHTSAGTWRDVLELSTKPVVFTHSCAAALFEHQRNVDDETLRKLAAKGGVIQVTLVSDFMTKGNPEEVGIKEMVDHIDHIVSVAGIDHVGIGMDFEGGGGGIGFNSADEAVNLTALLMERGYSDEDIAKIWGENYLRVLDEVQSGSQNCN